MKLSIIVPVYNMAADGKLEYCLNSLLNQTIEDYEIIAVDDASTDHSLSILRDYETKYLNRIRVIASPENRKQGGAKNLGIMEATGEWIGFVDSDDWVAPRMYEKLISKAEETGADVVGCDYSLVNQHTMEVGQIIVNNLQEQCGLLTKEKYKSLILKPGSMVIKIYKLTMIKSHALLFPEHIFYEDNCMGVLWLLFCKHFERVPEPLYYYYQHDQSTVHTTSVDRMRHRMQAMDKLLRDSRQYGFYKQYPEELEFRFVELYLVNTLYSYLLGVKPLQTEFVMELLQGCICQVPNFFENKYYQERIHPEQKKQIQMLLKNPFLFLWYFKTLTLYRKLRKKLHI
jgi:glycosyltransferase involved in cell wall biosynthesis